jgi:uncharacterized protein YndB with AHSA1/START domain
MAAGSSMASDQNELVLTRVFDAPRELVFKMWTDPKHLAKWWGPRGYTIPVCEIDLRPGGSIRIYMRAEDGVGHPITGTYREIIEPERLVFTASVMDDQGDVLFEVLNTVTFTDQEGKTKQTVHACVIHKSAKGEPYAAGMDQGWAQTLDRLEELVVANAQEPS